MINLGRWIAVLPAAVLAWYGCFLVGLLTLFHAGQMCPPGQLESGLCGAWWYAPLSATIEAAFVALSAIGVVCIAALVAPRHKVRVAWAAYGGGSLVAAYFAWHTGALLDFAAAEIVGLAAAVLVHCHDRRATLDPTADPLPEAA